MKKPKVKLDRYGRAKWKEYEPTLAERTGTTLADWDLLEQYCLNYQVIQLANESMATDGINITNSAGSIAANPATRLYVAAQKQNIVLSEKLQLTSLSVSKGNLPIEDDEEADFF